MEYFVEIYNLFNELDAFSKFYLSLFCGMCIFLYKTFLNMYSDERKQSEAISKTAGETISKLDAAITIYKGSEKDRTAQDKLIEKMGECYLYLNYETRKKVRLYYANRSESTLMTLDQIITKTLNNYTTFGDKQLVLEQLFSYFVRIIKPAVPLFLSLIILFTAIINFNEYHHTSDQWGKILIVSKYVAFITSLIIGLGLINILVEGRRLRNPGFLFWMCTIALIISPWLLLVVNVRLLEFSIVLQIISFIVLFIAKNKK